MPLTTQNEQNHARQNMLEFLQSSTLYLHAKVGPRLVNVGSDGGLFMEVGRQKRAKTRHSARNMPDSERNSFSISMPFAAMFPPCRLLVFSA